MIKLICKKSGLVSYIQDSYSPLCEYNDTHYYATHPNELFSLVANEWRVVPLDYLAASIILRIELKGLFTQTDKEGAYTRKELNDFLVALDRSTLLKFNKHCRELLPHLQANPIKLNLGEALRDKKSLLKALHVVVSQQPLSSDWETYKETHVIPPKVRRETVPKKISLNLPSCVRRIVEHLPSMYEDLDLDTKNLSKLLHYLRPDTISGKLRFIGADPLILEKLTAKLKELRALALGSDIIIRDDIYDKSYRIAIEYISKNKPTTAYEVDF